MEVQKHDIREFLERESQTLFPGIGVDKVVALLLKKSPEAKGYGLFVVNK
jgi:hypothetical protein